MKREGMREYAIEDRADAVFAAEITKQGENMSYKTEFKTGPMEGRLAWCFLDQPRTVDMNGKPKDKPSYECAYYFPKTHADPRQCRNYAFFAQMALEVVQNAYRGAWPMIGPGGVWTDWPIDDCDTPAIADKYPWARGMWAVRLSGGKYRPRVFDANNNQIELGVDGRFRPGTIKGGDGIGGDWAMISVNAYEWDYGASRKGVSFGVEGIKVTRMDEQIGGGGRSGEAMFGAPTGQPVFGGAPPAPQYGAPPAPPQGPYGAPPAPQYGAPPAPQYGAPLAQQYGAPPAPPQGPYGAPPAPQYGGYGAPPQPGFQQPAAPQPPAYGATPPATYPATGPAAPHAAATVPGYATPSLSNPPLPGPQVGPYGAQAQIGQR